MLTLIIAIIGVFITLVLVIGVHELGHFTVAKLSGIKVLRFSIGFGKPLFIKRDKSGTEYVMAAIPLGGYVKMLDEGEGVVYPHEKHLAFNQQPFYKKMAVIAAGPIANLIFALLIYWILFIIGFVSIAPVIGTVSPNSIAAKAGIGPQLEILSIDGKSTRNWTSVIIRILSRAGESSTLKIQTKDLSTKQIKNFEVSLKNWHLDDLRPDPLLSLGIKPYEPLVPSEIGTVLPGSPADIANLKPHDLIMAIAGKTIQDWQAMVGEIQKHADETLNFTIKRQQQIMTLPVKIGSDPVLFAEPQGYLGATASFKWPDNLLRNNQYGPILALAHAWQNVGLFTTMNFIVFGKMLTGKISLQSLGGPITIFSSAGTALNNGLFPFLSFLAFLSVSIGIINIIPIPGLDGGHLLFQLIEFITRRPLSTSMQIFIYRCGMIALMLLMVQALVNDMLRL